MQCQFHLPIPIVRNRLLEGVPEEVLCLSLIIPILLGFPIHALPILVWYLFQGKILDDMMAVRGKVCINEGRNRAEDDVMGSLDDDGGLIPGSDYLPLVREVRVGDGGGGTHIRDAIVYMY